MGGVVELAWLVEIMDFAWDMGLFLFDFRHLHDSLDTHAQKPQFRLILVAAFESEPELSRQQAS
jgi:hypothetical protein